MESVGVDVHVKYDDSMSNRSRVIRATHFVIDERRNVVPKNRPEQTRATSGWPQIA